MEGPQEAQEFAKEGILVAKRVIDLRERVSHDGVCLKWSEIGIPGPPISSFVKANTYTAGIPRIGTPPATPRIASRPSAIS
jgi:hypothetical protein